MTTPNKPNVPVNPSPARPVPPVTSAVPAADLASDLPQGAFAAQGEQADLYVLQGSASTTVEKIALKHGDAFMVTDARGDLPTSEQETGLFWHGSRFLRTCDLFLNGLPLIALSHSISDEEGACQIDLTNPFLQCADEECATQGTIHVRRQLALHGRSLVETLTVTSFHPASLEVSLALQVGADYEDIFEVRGLVRGARGKLAPPEVSRDGVTLRYLGRDLVERVSRLTFEPAATATLPSGIVWKLTLTRDAPVVLQMVMRVSEFSHQGSPTSPEGASSGVIPRTALADPDTSASSLLLPEITSDNVFFNRLLSRGSHDLVMMCTLTPQGLYPYGGIPWYVCPFGRDALITSLEFLPWFPEVARGTLAFLSAHQGVKVDEFTEEEPGRILHEYRRGELANCHEIPFIPYYGTVDATPLFLIILEHYIRWTDDLVFLRQHWSNARAAAQWLLTYGDHDGDTFIEYHKVSDKGLVSQGWKDSWDAVSHRDGRLAEGPIALCEVQGYAYAAYHAMAYLADRMGLTDEAGGWRDHARAIQANFLERFWWADERAFYMALDGAKQPCAVMSSNAGQCLWSGIVPEHLAEGVIERMMQDDMYTEWGIRTLSSREARYNPMSYHNGSVWPHDTALIGAGFARYGRKDEAAKLLGNLFGVSLYYEGARLPELFCGFTRLRGFGPTRYPVACAPQSWAAGAPFLLLDAVLGFEPNATQGRLTLRNPVLPDWLDHLDMRGLRLADRRGHLQFEESKSGTAVHLTNDTEIDIHVVPK